MAAKRLGKKDRELTSREQSILDFIRQKVWEVDFRLLFVRFVRLLDYVPLQQYMDILPAWKNLAL